MSDQCITLTTLGGTDLNPGGGEYTSKTRVPHRLTSNTRGVQVAQRTGKGPQYTGTTFDAREIEVVHNITGSTTTHETNLHKLRKEHYRNRHDALTLVYTDTDGVAKQATVKVVGMREVGDEYPEHMVIGTWLLLDIVELANSAGSVAAVAKTSSPATLSVANAGDEDSETAIVTLKPTAQKVATVGQLYGYYITPVNRNPWPVIRWPVCMTEDYGGSAGFDHAAEVTATRSAADADDVEFYANDKRVPRWTSNANDAATKFWCNLTLPPARWWTYNGAATLANNATSMTVREPLVDMPPLPFHAAFVESSAQQEVILVTAYDAETKTFTIDRAERGTTGQTHAVGSKLYHVPVVCEMVYGFTSAPAPDYINDDEKPMINMTSSDNGSFVWADFQETEAAAETQGRKPRTASWRTRDTLDRGREKATAEGDRYLRYIPRTATLSTDAATASAMCMAYRSEGALAGHPLQSEWYFQSPIGITQIAFTQTTSTLDFTNDNEALLRLVATGLDGAEQIVDSYEEDAATGETETPSANAYDVAFRIYPFDPKIDSNTVELLAGEPTDADGFIIDSVTATLDSTEEILLLWGGSRRNIYQFGRPTAPATVANASGDTLEIAGLVVTINDTVDVDITSRTLTIDDGTKHGSVASGTYPPIPPGTNNLTYTEAGLSGGATVEVGVSSYRSAWLT